MSKSVNYAAQEIRFDFENVILILFFAAVKNSFGLQNSVNML